MHRLHVVSYIVDFLLDVLVPQLRKTDMLRKGQEGHVRAERDVLKSASLVNSPNGGDWIVRLYYSFQDRDHLYLVRLPSIVRGVRHPLVVVLYYSLSNISFHIFRYSSTWAAVIS